MILPGRVLVINAHRPIAFTGRLQEYRALKCVQNERPANYDLVFRLRGEGKAGLYVELLGVKRFCFSQEFLRLRAVTEANIGLS